MYSTTHVRWFQDGGGPFIYDMVIYLRELQRKTKKKTDRDGPFRSSPHKWSQLPATSQAKAKTPELHLGHQRGWQGHSHLRLPSIAFPDHRQESGRKRSSMNTYGMLASQAVAYPTTTKHRALREGLGKWNEKQWKHRS